MGRVIEIHLEFPSLAAHDRVTAGLGLYSRDSANVYEGNGTDGVIVRPVCNCRLYGDEIYMTPCQMCTAPYVKEISSAEIDSWWASWGY